jgi:hypothetical protein
MRVLWRAGGDLEWLEAVGLNVSRTGVLFRAGRVLAIGSEVELIFALSQESDPWMGVADVRCFGRVVRSDAAAEGPQSSVAATIDGYSLIREPEMSGASC